jgi:serine phosphatase RsbU (regulator of sigma subunit)/pSer/pThr/pTyr-binding forkhead associated (FHA) protein
MASLIAKKGPTPGRRFMLSGDCAVIGRQPDAAIYLESLAVSRQHARIVCDKGVYYVEDLGSSNGTWLNGEQVKGRAPLTESDELQIGPYVLNLQPDPPSGNGEGQQQVIRARIEALPSNQTLFSQNPAYKLQVVLEIAHHLGQTLELDPLLNRLLEQLFRLFPQADRGMVLLCEGDRLVVRAQRLRHQGASADYPYSRTIVRRALEEGVGLLSQDVGVDGNLPLTATLVSLNLRSFLCVPLIGWEGRRLGVIQLDALRQSQPFREEELEVLTAVALQVAVVLQNAAYHAERLREERFRQELLLAREIQQSFLPTDFQALQGPHTELYAKVEPARGVSGDFYDFFKLPDGRLVFFVGDVTGKGMPAALFMIAVRTLTRQLAPAAAGPGELLSRLHAALSADNPTQLFVTLACGTYDARDGAIVVAAGGHPAPLLRRKGGAVEEVAITPGMMIGSAPMALRFAETRLKLAAGETFILYTDGMTEGFAPDGVSMFGLDRLREVLGGPRAALPLAECVAAACAAVQRFTGEAELQDDQTLFLLRRA